MYGRASDARIKINGNKNFKRPSPEETAGPRIPTLATDVHADEGGDNREIKKPLSTSEEAAEVITVEMNFVRSAGEHTLSQSVLSSFLSKSVAWRRRFARFKALCY